jgi:hypothetical protein
MHSRRGEGLPPVIPPIKKPQQAIDPLRQLNQPHDYFAGAGGFSPVFFVVDSSVFVVVPPGVAVVVSFFTFDFSPQPTRPIESTLNTKTEAKMRFIFYSFVKGI